MPRQTWHNLDPERRDRVLRAAMAEFGSQGYSGGSLNVIARAAGVAKGSLFQYFDDKFDLFAYVAEQTSLSIYAALLPHLDGPGAGQPFADYFDELVDAWIAFMAAHPLERGVTAATTMELDPDVRSAVRAPVHQLYVQGIRPLLENAVATGELRSDTDVDALLSVLILLLPHLALAPFEPGLDSAVQLFGRTGARRSATAHRLVATVLTPALTGVAR
ncbi:MAG: TetR/AcrR family transcriptional regulator [Jatrophihabitantaceae bacterium]